MVREVAPNLSYHYWYLGIRGIELDEEADPLVLVRGSEFQHSREIEMEDDEGHTGTATTKMSSYRTKASANPSYTDKCRYKEGWEDLWLLLLGSAKVEVALTRMILSRKKLLLVVESTITLSRLMLMLHKIHTLQHCIMDLQRLLAMPTNMKTVCCLNLS